MTVTRIKKIPPAVWFAYSADRQGEHPQQHLAQYSGVLQADVYGGYDALYESGRVTEAGCMAYARRKVHNEHARRPTELTREALTRIGGLYAIEAEICGSSKEQRLAARQEQMKTLSTHAEIMKAFSYILKQWNALNAFIRNGQVEIDNNIAENALRGVALGRKNWLCADSDKGGETAAIIYSLIGTSKLNGVEPESWLREVISKIDNWPSNQVHALLPWNLQLVK